MFALYYNVNIHYFFKNPYNYQKINLLDIETFISIYKQTRKMLTKQELINDYMNIKNKIPFLRLIPRIITV